jgi:predicted dehydrogenase
MVHTSNSSQLTKSDFDKPEFTKPKFRWGIIGTGGIAKAFARDLSYFNSHIIQAVGSRSIEKASDFAVEFPGCTAYGSYEELVADPMIDAVYVATPHPQHVANTILALSAGKPVLCEKPFAVNAIEARAMVAAARTNNVALLEAMWTRFLPHIAQVREILKSEVIGQIVNVEADHGQFLIDHENPRLTEPSLAGGALLDLGIYPVSFAHMILGVPSRITATGVLTEKGVDSQTSAIFDYADGAQAVVTTTLVTGTPCRATISGTLGRIEIDRTFYNPASMRVIMRDGTTTEYPNTYKGHGLREQAAELERMVRNAEIESPLLTHQMSVEIMQTLDEIRNQIGLRYPFEN